MTAHLDRPDVPTSRDKRLTKRSTSISLQRTAIRKGLIKNGPIHEAALTGNVSEAARLLNDKPTMVHKRGLYMRTPLLCASSRGHLPVVKLLVEEGAALDDTDEIKWSALHHAAANGHAAVIHYLADEGRKERVVGRAPLATPTAED